MLVEECDGHSLHLPQVHLVGKVDRSMRFLVVRDGDRTIGCGPAFDIARRVMRVSIGSRMLSLPTALALSGEAQSRKAEVYRELAVFAKRSGFGRLVIQRAWGEDFSAEEALSPYIVGRGIDFTIDLTATVEDLQAAMHKYHRKNVRRAVRKGITLVKGTGEDALLRLRELQLASAGRKGGQFGVGDAAFFRRLYESIYKPGTGGVLFATMDEQYVAGLAYLSSEKKAQTVRSGSTDAGNKYFAMYLLQFELITRLKEAGVELLNIGGVPAEAVDADHPQHGLYKFKQGFGGAENLRTVVDVPLKNFIISAC